MKDDLIYSNNDMMNERRHHEKNKYLMIEELEKKIQTIKELNSLCDDESLKQYYMGYIRAYNDCIHLINSDKYY